MPAQTQIKSAKQSTIKSQDQLLQDAIWDAQDAATIASNAANKAQGYHRLISEKVGDLDLRVENESFARQGTDRRLAAIDGQVSDLSRSIMIKGFLAGLAGAAVFSLVVTPFLTAQQSPRMEQVSK